MIVAITGHREVPDIQWVYENLREAYGHIDATHVIQGMASGVDLWSARAAYDETIPYTCARPWAGHTPRNADEKMYANALKNAAAVVNVNPIEVYSGKHLYFDRNHWMVDNSDGLIAVWNGDYRSGTGECLTYAKKQGKPIYRIDPVKKGHWGWASYAK